MNKIIVLLLFCNFSIVYGQIWENIGPEGGFFKDFVIHPNDPNIIYAGSDDGGGVWKSLDGGNSWELLTGDFPNFTGWSIEMDYEHPDTLYFCELYGRYGILKTTDGGATLEHQTDGFILNRDLQATHLAIYPGAGDTLFLSTGEGGNFGRVGNGVFSSFNGGENWNYAGLQNISIHAIEITSTERIIAGTDLNGLYYSDDVGASWIVHPDIPDTATILEMDIMNDVVVVSAAANGVYVSYDDGVSFNNIGAVGDFNFDLTILRTAPYLEIISTGFIQPNRYSSETGFWTPLGEPLMFAYLLMGIEALDGVIYAGIFSSTKIIRSLDGGASWHQLDHNPVATEIRALAVDETNDRIYGSLQNSYNMAGNAYNKESIVVSEDGGENWIFTGPLAHGLDMQLHPSDPQTLYLGTFANGLFKTTDGFDTWENSREGNKLIIAIAINESSPEELLISEYDFETNIFGIYKSVNGADSFYKTGEIVATDIVYKGTGDTIYFSHETGVYLSDDNGESFSITPVYLSGENVLALHQMEDNLLAGTEEGELYTINALGTVTNITGPWNSVGPTEVRNIGHFGNSIYVGLNGAEQDTLHNLNGGVWKSSDGGASWVDLSAGLTNNNIFGNTGLKTTTDGRLFIGTYGQGIFKLDGLSIGIAETDQLLVNTSIYPNPATNAVQITANNGTLINDITIYSLSGEVIFSKSTVNQSVFMLDCTGFAAGSYLIEIDAGGHRSNHQILISNN